MTNRLADRRGDLYAELVPLLPGRVEPYPRTFGEAAAPAIWIEQASIQTPDRRGIVANFPVWIIYDGTDRAQVAGLDELVSNVYDAIDRTAGFRAGSANPQAVAGTLRAAVVNGSVTIASRTLCMPDAPGAATVPPDILATV